MFIREWRKKAGLTQEKLAETIEVHVNTLAKWENQNGTPRIDKVQKICQALGCTETDLINGPTKKEFEVKIFMGVKSLPNVAGLAIDDDSFFFGVDDDKPQIHLGGLIGIATEELREKALKKITDAFWKACWMYDNKDKAIVPEADEEKHNEGLN